MDNLKGLFTSKKFWMTILGVLASMLIAAVPALEEYRDTMPEIIWKLVGAYVIGQGMADFGKAAK